MPSGRWTTAFLDKMRKEGDPEADHAFQLILEDKEIDGVRALFSVMNSNDDIPPAEHFPILSSFFTSTEDLPAGIDQERIHRGEDVFEDHAFSGALALLAKSLPEGYQAPNLAIILSISGNLRAHTYRRLLGTLQTVVNVSTCRGFQRGGRAIVTAQKLRLLHAGVRALTPRARPGFVEAYGTPVNQEDMLATIVGFSLLVIEGWRTLKTGLTREEEEDYLYMWLVFARMMGVHPPDQPESTAYIPEDVEDATAFYEAYRERHYVDGATNPDGVRLAAANLKMLKMLIPLPLRLLGFGFLPRMCMTDLLRNDSCRKLKIRPVRGHRILKTSLSWIHAMLLSLQRSRHPHHERLGMILFNTLIKKAYDGSVTYTVPTNVAQLRSMIDRETGSSWTAIPSHQHRHGASR
jgi:hypothetical protein